MTRPHPLALCAALLIACLASLLLMLDKHRAPASTSADPLAQCKSNLRLLASSLRFYAEDHQGHYPNTLNQLVPHYLGSIPKCPAVHHDRYSAGYRSSAQPDRYVVACCGQNHQSDALGPNLPAMSSDKGLLYARPPTEHRLIACKARLSKAGSLVENHRKAHGQLPKSLRELSSSWPLDFDYSLVGEKHFRLSCPALSHAYEGLQPYEPAYNSQVGLVPSSSPPPEFVSSPRLREALQPKIPLPLCIPIFIFVLFILWPFEAAGQRPEVGWVNQSESGWKMIARKKKHP